MDIIVVLGSSLIKGKLSPENIGRLNIALEVYKEKKDSDGSGERVEGVERAERMIFILSGKGNGMTTEAEVMQDFLLQKGIPQSDILVEVSSDNTIENIINTSNMIRGLINDGNKIRSITYVSSDYHIPRVSAILNYFGVEGIPLFSAGSKTYPPGRVAKEQILMKNLEKQISYYQ